MIKPVLEGCYFKMNILYDKEIKCPVCEKKYTTKKVRSSALRLEKKDSDFCMHYKGVNPLFYSAYVCPHCGYSSTEKKYRDISPAQRTMIIDNISSRWSGKDYGGIRNFDDAIEVHKLAMISYSTMSYKDSEMAKLCLKLAWLYRQANNTDMEKYYLKYSLKYFEKAYYSERLDENQENELNIIYLMGDINKRLGNYKEAVNYFQLSLQHGYLPNARGLEKLVRDSWYETKELSSKEKKAV